MDLFGKCDQIRRKLADLVTFIEEILNGNLHFYAVAKTLCAGHPDTMTEAASWHPFRQKARFPKRALFRDFSQKEHLNISTPIINIQPIFKVFTRK